MNQSWTKDLLLGGKAGVMSDWKAGVNKDLVATVGVGREPAVELGRKGEVKGWT